MPGLLQVEQFVIYLTLVGLQPLLVVEEEVVAVEVLQHWEEVVEEEPMR